MHGIVIQLDPGADLEIGIRRTQPVDLVEIDTAMIAIVIRQGDVAQANLARVVGPWLEQFLGVGLKTVALWMQVVVGESFIGFEIRDS